MKRIEWENYQDGDSTPLNAENLNLMQDNIEDGIEALEDGIEALEDGIENVDNRLSDEEIYTTATAGSNGDFHVTLSNTTLTTNRVVKIAFPAATNGASNARLSIDNGVSYYDIICNNDDNLLASRLQLKQVVLRFNGSAWKIENGIPMRELIWSGAWSSGTISFTKNIYNYRYCIVMLQGQSTYLVIPILSETNSRFRGMNGTPFTSSFSLLMLNATMDSSYSIDMTWCRSFSFNNTSGTTITMTNETVSEIWGVI